MLNVQCPRCETSLVLNPAQITASHGWARCGHCQFVFDAGQLSLPTLAPRLPTDEPTRHPAPDQFSPIESEAPLEQKLETVLASDTEDANTLASEAALAPAFEPSPQMSIPPPPEPAPAPVHLDQSEVNETLEPHEGLKASSTWTAIDLELRADPDFALDAHVPAEAQSSPALEEAPITDGAEHTDATGADPLLLIDDQDHGEFGASTQQSSKFEPAWLDKPEQKSNTDLDTVDAAETVAGSVHTQIDDPSDDLVTEQTSPERDRGEAILEPAWLADTRSAPEAQDDEPAPQKDADEEVTLAQDDKHDETHGDTPSSAEEGEAMFINTAIAEPSPEEVQKIENDGAELDHWSALKRRNRSRGWQVLLGLLLMLLLVGQFVYIQRNSLVARWPTLTPALSQMCKVLACDIQALRDVRQLQVVHSAVVRLPNQHFQMDLELRNDGLTRVETPQLELSLQDASGHTWARRILPLMIDGEPKQLDAQQRYNAQVKWQTNETDASLVEAYQLRLVYLSNATELGAPAIKP